MGTDIVVGVALAVSMIFPMAWLLNQRMLYITTVHMHRGVTHEALQLRYGLRLWCDYSLNRMGMWMRYWVYVHRKHHANTDTVDDPHAPFNILDYSIEDEDQRLDDAVRRHLKTNLVEYRSAATRSEVLAMRKPDLTFIDGWGSRLGLGVWVVTWLTHLIPYTAVGLLLGVNMWTYLPFAGGAAVVSLVWAGGMYIRGSSAVNTYGHAWPVRSINRSVGHASNHNWTARRTGGEGRQYDHHLRQRSARIRSLHGTRWVDDIGWVIIRTLRALRLTRFVREDPREAPLPEMRELDRRGRPVRVLERAA